MFFTIMMFQVALNIFNLCFYIRENTKSPFLSLNILTVLNVPPQAPNFSFFSCFTARSIWSANVKKRIKTFKSLTIYFHFTPCRVQPSRVNLVAFKHTIMCPRDRRYHQTSISCFKYILNFTDWLTIEFPNSFWSGESLTSTVNDESFVHVDCKGITNVDDGWMPWIWVWMVSFVWWHNNWCTHHLKKNKDLLYRCCSF